MPNIQKYENVFDEYTCSRSKTCETANDCVDLWKSGTEQKKRKNQHNEEIQTKKPTKINHFKTNVFKCVLIVKKTNKENRSFEIVSAQKFVKLMICSNSVYWKNIVN